MEFLLYNLVYDIICGNEKQRNLVAHSEDFFINEKQINDARRWYAYVRAAYARAFRTTTKTMRTEH